MKHTRERYVREILEHCRTTPVPGGRIRTADRRLAENLYRQGIAAHTVRSALLLAAARRTFRNPDLGPLEPIGSVHYFLPVLDEIQRQPTDPGYLLHIENRLAESYAELVADRHRFP
jgi:hypothetical protein